MLADVPHVLKNMRNALLNNKIIWLSPDHLEEAKLEKGSFAEWNVLVRLYYFLQEQKKLGNLLTIAPHLTYEVLFPGPFAKMKVNLAKSVFSKETATAIRFVVEHFPDRFRKTDLTTAYFIDCVADWYNLCNNRKRCLAFSKMNEDVHAQVTAYLIWFMEFYGMCNMYTTGRLRITSPWLTSPRTNVAYFLLPNLI